MKITKVAHLADIHFRLASRFDEYLHVLENLSKKFQVDKPDTIVISGDIFHNKVNLSPESYYIATKFFDKLVEHAPVILIAGNHDANLTANRQDAISAFVELFNRGQNKNPLYYLKNTTEQGFNLNGISYFVKSLLDKDDINYENVKQASKNAPTVLLYHGQISGSENEGGFKFEESEHEFKFDSFDAVMLGDIHKFQYLNKEKTVAYSSSLVCQDHGEHPLDHGYILWEFDQKELKGSKFVRVENDYTHLTCVYNSEYIVEEKFKHLLSEGSNTKVRLLVMPEDFNKRNEIVDSFMEQYPIAKKPTVSKIKTNIGQDAIKIKDDIIDMTKKEVQVEAFKQYFSDDKHLQKILDFHDKVFDMASEKFERKNHRNEFVPTYFEFSNLFNYGENNTFDFTQIKNSVMSLGGSNGTGKSSFLDAITFSIYGTTPVTSTYDEVLNARKKQYSTFIKISSDMGFIEIERTGRKTEKTFSNKVTWRRFDSDGGELLEENSDANEVKKLVSDYFGDVKSFSRTSYIYQDSNDSFLNLTKTSRLEWLYSNSGASCFEVLNKEAKKISKGDRDDYAFHSKQQYKNQLNDLLTKKKETNESLKPLIKEQKENKKELNAIENKIKSIEDSIWKLEEKIKDAPEDPTDLINKQRNELTKAESELEDKVEALNKECEVEVVELNLKLNEQQKKLQELKESTLESSYEYQNAVKNIETTEYEITELKTKIKKLNSKVSEYYTEFETLEHDKEKFEETQSKLNDLNDSLSDLQKRKENLVTEYTTLEKSVDLLESDDRYTNEKLCSTCPLLKGAFKSSTRALEVYEQIEDIQNKINEHRDQISKLQSHSNEFDQSRYDFLEKNIMQEIPHKIDILKQSIQNQESKLEIYKESRDNVSKTFSESKEEKVSSIEDKISDISDRIDNIDKEFKNKREILEGKYENKIESLKISIQSAKNNLEKFEESKDLVIKVSELKKEFNELDSKRYDKTKDIENLDSEISSIENTLIIVDNDIEKTNANIKLTKELGNKVEVFDKYINSTTKSQIPLLLIQKILDNINAEVNAVLNSLVYFNLELVVEDDSVECYMHYDDRGTRKASRLSGMEGFVANLAFRVAISVISNMPFANFIMIDESFSKMDSNIRQEVPSIFTYLKEIYDFAIVIDHNEFIRDVVDKDINTEIVGKDSFLSSSNLS